MKKLSTIMVPSIDRVLGSRPRQVFFEVVGFETPYGHMVYIKGHRGTTGGRARYRWTGTSLKRQVGGLILSHEQTTDIEAALRRGELRFQDAV